MSLLIFYVRSDCVLELLLKETVNQGLNVWVN